MASGDCGTSEALSRLAFFKLFLLRLFTPPARLLRDVPEKAGGFPS
jgi:hypothetical protein